MDYGYNYSMDQGRVYVEKKLNVKTLSQENVPVSAEVTRVMEKMIRGGCEIIFATSYGYLDYAIALGEKYPKVSFRHAGGLKTSPNVGTYFANSDDAMYLAGMAAGGKTKSAKLGFVAAFPIPQVLRSINSFTMGAQAVNPKATTRVVWTGGWLNPAKEAESANALADAGVDVIGEQIDSPITLAKTAQKRKIYVVGKDVNVQKFADKAYLTGASWDWGPMMAKLVQEVWAGTWKPSHRCVGTSIKDGTVKVDPLRDAQYRDRIQEKDRRGTGGHPQRARCVVWKGTVVGQAGRLRHRSGWKSPREGGRRNDQLPGQRRHRNGEVIVTDRSDPSAGRPHGVDAGARQWRVGKFEAPCRTSWSAADGAEAPSRLRRGAAGASSWISPGARFVCRVDMQNDFCRKRRLPRQPRRRLHARSEAHRAHPRASCRVLRDQGVPIVWLNWGVRPDLLNTSPALLHAHAQDGSGAGLGETIPGGASILVEGSWGAAIVDELVPEPGDLKVTQYRLSGFWDTPLDTILKNLGVTTLFFAGVNADQCVMTTLQDAMFLGYDCVMVEDCVGTTSPAFCMEATLYNVKLLFGFVTRSSAIAARLVGAKPDA